MNPLSLLTLLRAQQAAQFADVSGAQASIEVPISDRLISEAIAARLSPSSPVRVVAEAGNRIAVHVRLTRPAFLPVFRIRLLIEEQPNLPSSPVIVLKLVSEGVAALAGSVNRFLGFLPPGVSLNGDRLTVNLAKVPRQYHADEALTYLTHVQLTTTEGRVIVTARAAVPPSTTPA